jgi:hypothetical protein
MRKKLSDIVSIRADIFHEKRNIMIPVLTITSETLRFPVRYLTTLLQNRDYTALSERLTNNELESTWKEAVATQSSYVPEIWL